MTEPAERQTDILYLMRMYGRNDLNTSSSSLDRTDCWLTYTSQHMETEVIGILPVMLKTPAALWLIPRSHWTITHNLRTLTGTRMSFDLYQSNFGFLISHRISAGMLYICCGSSSPNTAWSKQFVKPVMTLYFLHICHYFLLFYSICGIFFFVLIWT